MKIFNYPVNNYELLQKYIPYKIVKYKNGKYYIMINVFNNDTHIFGYSLYFNIDEKFNPSYSGNEIYEFLSDINNDQLYDKIFKGTDNLVLGVDYFVSGNNEDDETIMSQNINDYEDLSDLRIKDIDNILYFINKNEIIDYPEFSDDELNSLNQTFMNIIKNMSDAYDNIQTNNDLVYKYVIDYFSNGQFDDAILLMNSIFNTKIQSTTTSCGCNSQSTCVSSSQTQTINTGTELVPVDTASCIDKYKAAIYQWLIDMLSNIEFYCNWMYINVSDSDNLYIPNDGLIDNLIGLLEQFLIKGYDLNNLNSKSNECKCCNKIHTNGQNINCADFSSNNYNINSCTNISIIENYIQVLKWIKNDEINENKNKIYIFGKQFAEIFPKLSF